MKNPWEVSGISLQICAGFVFILEQLSHKYPEAVDRLNRAFRLRSVSQIFRTKARWAAVILLSVIALPLFITIVVVVATHSTPWSTIAGVLVFTVVGFDVYGFCLARFSIQPDTTGLAAQVQDVFVREQVVSANRYLFVVSFCSLAASYFVQTYLLSYARNPAADFAFILYFLSTRLVALPVLYFSFVFVVLEWLIRQLVSVRPGYYWAVIVVAWLVGGAFLLVHAILG